VSIHFLVRFEPLAGKERDFREELLRIVEPTRDETGCLAIRAFESLLEPFVFAIHSEWVDEAAFDLHAQLPHTVRFLRAAGKLLTHPVEGLRSREIAGGAGAGAMG
jgi:quinol monooxygenase YgiN